MSVVSSNQQAGAKFNWESALDIWARVKMTEAQIEAAKNPVVIQARDASQRMDQTHDVDAQPVTTQVAQQSFLASPAPMGGSNGLWLGIAGLLGVTLFVSMGRR